MVKRSWILSRNLISFIWFIQELSLSTSSLRCQEGKEYANKDGNCVPCTRCNGSFIVVSPCYIFQDAKCAAPSAVIQSWEDRPNPKEISQHFSDENVDSVKSQLNHIKPIKKDAQSMQNSDINTLREIALSNTKVILGSHDNHRGTENIKNVRNKDKRKRPCPFPYYHRHKHKHRSKLKRNNKSKHLRCRNESTNDNLGSNSSTYIKIKNPHRSNVDKKSSTTYLPPNRGSVYRPSEDVFNLTSSENETLFNDSIMPILSNSQTYQNASDLYLYILISAIFIVIGLFFAIILIGMSYFYRDCQKKRIEKQNKKKSLANTGLSHLHPSEAQVADNPSISETQPMMMATLCPLNNRTTVSRNGHGFTTLPLSRSDRGLSVSAETSTLPLPVNCTVPGRTARSNNSTPRVLRRLNSIQSPQINGDNSPSTGAFAQLLVPNVFLNSCETNSNTPSPFMDRLLEQRRAVGFTASVENNLYVETWKGPPTPVISRLQHQTSDRISVPLNNQQFIPPSESPIAMRTFRRPTPVTNSSNHGISVARNKMSTNNRCVDSSNRGFNPLSFINNSLNK